MVDSAVIATAVAVTGYRRTTMIITMVTNAPDQEPDVASTPDPYPTPDQMAMGLRRWFRAIIGIVLLAALLVCVILGIYRVIEARSAENHSSVEINRSVCG